MLSVMAPSDKKSPFPGMDPYLESPEIWPGFHQRFAVELADELNPRIGPKYYADVSLRTVGETVEIGTTHISHPDVGVYDQRGPEPHRQDRASGSAIVLPTAPIVRDALLEDLTALRTVHIYQTGTDALVTAMEILSPYNKRRWEGLEEYRAKRKRLLRSSTHLIEIDLLRGDERPGPEVLSPPLATDYVILVNRFREDLRRRSEIWPVAISERLPVIPVPLLPPDADVPLDLNAAVSAVYGPAGYGWRIDYACPLPAPEPRAEVVTWLRQDLGHD